jgi:hypothetical protein
MGKFNQGLYKPLNPKKYIGNPNQICYRSGWERIAMRNFDLRPDVIKWCSEEIAIPYYNSIKKRMARYFPDFYVEFINKEGVVTKCIIEIKPLKEINFPVASPRKKQSTRLYEQFTYVNNQEKWESARKYCELNGLKFVIMSEKDLFPNRK